MRKHYVSTDGSLVLGHNLSLGEGPHGDGAVTVPVNGISLTIDGENYSGITGSCIFPPEQKADPTNSAATYVGSFAFTVTGDDITAMTGTVTGSFDSDGAFHPQSFTEVTLSHPLSAAPGFSQILQPRPDEGDLAQATITVIAKPSAG